MASKDPDVKPATRGRRPHPKPTTTAKPPLAASTPKPQLLVPNPEAGERIVLPQIRKRRLTSLFGGLVFALLILLAGFNLLYAGKVYPGVTANGVYLGGLSRDAAAKALQDRIDQYQAEVIRINYSGTALAVSPTQLGLNYDVPKAVDLAMAYGRGGGAFSRLHEEFRAIVGHQTAIASYHYDPSKLTPYIDQVDSDTNQPVANASFSFGDNNALIKQPQLGRRLDRGGLTLDIQDRLAATSADPIDAPVYDLHPQIEASDLVAAQTQANQYLAGPVTLKLPSGDVTVSPDNITSFFKLDPQMAKDFAISNDVRDIYPRPTLVSLSLDGDAVKGYVKKLAAKTDRQAQDAQLTIQDGKVGVFQPSHDGAALNQAKAVSDLTAALTKSADDRTVAVEVTTVHPSVYEGNLNDLGINELISEGFSTFPGSSSARLTNVRIGASKYNNILIKPGEVFSFGAILGDVGPAEGYQPSLVIIGNHEEKQYGGGMCQVSSTMYRAALNAGLPIVERTNHSFAVDFYTQPYGVPGVDATIYYPQVDFKFKNDTGHYILVQTIMQGTTLKFDFYGTKTKTGHIRGPQFVSGSLDATKPSHTVFWRDVLDLSGNVIKTDTVDTYYKSSTDFTIVDNQLH